MLYARDAQLSRPHPIKRCSERVRDRLEDILLGPAQLYEALRARSDLPPSATSLTSLKKKAAAMTSVVREHLPTSEVQAQVPRRLPNAEATDAKSCQ
jgi:hypothetical protein